MIAFGSVGIVITGNTKFNAGIAESIIDKSRLGNPGIELLGSLIFGSMTHDVHVSAADDGIVITDIYGV